ncbi:MAG: lactate racemase domain-containing protein [Puniceicoccaceae bacterium]
MPADKERPSEPLAWGGPQACITKEQLEEHLETFVRQHPGVKRLLLIPPDITRLNSRAGEITAFLYHHYKEQAHVRIMPALGTHLPMSEDELRKMFGQSIPLDVFLVHDWRNSLIVLGQLEGSEVEELSGGRLDFPIDIGVNRELLDGEYDLIVSIGQVVPHEVIGMANYTKNILVGTGGGDTINKTHFMGAVCRMENIIGKTLTPVREALNKGFDRFVRDKVNITFIMSVVGSEAGKPALRGLFIGNDLETYSRACELSQAVNITHLERPVDKCIVYLNPDKYKSTWLGNKAIYRTCMAMADGGELIVLAPGLTTFGEDPEIDRLIRKYGYKGTDKTLTSATENSDLERNLSAAGHLMKGTSNGRFSITYCPGDGISRDEVESVGYSYCHYDKAASRYPVSEMVEGWNRIGEEDLFFIKDPALGLWMAKDRSTLPI